MKKIEQKEFVSQFDIADWNLLRFHQTLQINDFVRLIAAYKKDIELEDIKKIVGLYYDKMLTSALEEPFVIFGDKLFSTNIVYENGSREYKEESKRGLDGRLRILLKRDKDKEWKNELKYDGRKFSYKFSIKEKYDYYEISVNETYDKLAMESGVNGKKYMENIFDVNGLN